MEVRSPLLFALFLKSKEYSYINDEDEDLKVTLAPPEQPLLMTVRVLADLQWLVHQDSDSTLRIHYAPKRYHTRVLIIISWLHYEHLAIRTVVISEHELCILFYIPEDLINFSNCYLLLTELL